MIIFETDFDAYSPSERSVRDELSRCEMIYGSRASKDFYMIVEGNTLRKLIASGVTGKQIDSISANAAYFRSKAFLRCAGREIEEVNDDNVPGFYKAINLSGLKKFGMLKTKGSSIDRDCFSLPNTVVIRQGVIKPDSITGSIQEIRVPVINGRIAAGGHIPKHVLDKIVGSGFIEEYSTEVFDCFVADFAYSNGDLCVIEVNPLICFWPHDIIIEELCESIAILY